MANAREVLRAFMKLLASYERRKLERAVQARREVERKGRLHRCSQNKTAARRPPLPICAMVLTIPTHASFSTGTVFMHLESRKAHPECSIINQTDEALGPVR